MLSENQIHAASLHDLLRILYAFTFFVYMSIFLLASRVDFEKKETTIVIQISLFEYLYPALLCFSLILSFFSGVVV